MPEEFQLGSPYQLCYKDERAGQGWNKRLASSELQSSKNKIYQKHTDTRLAVAKGPTDKCTYSPHGLCHLAEATVKQNAHRHPSTRLRLFSKCCFSAFLWCPSSQTGNRFPAEIQSMGCGEPKPFSFLVTQGTSWLPGDKSGGGRNK